MNNLESLDPEKLLYDVLCPRSYTTHEDENEHRPEGLAFFGEDVVLPIFDEGDTQLLMQRDAHFSGSFSAMKEYYQNPDAKGVFEEIDPERIAFLEDIERRLKRNLAPLLICGSDAEKVAASRKMYQQLREAASKSDAGGLLAEAILSEKSVEEMLAGASKEILQKPEALLLIATSDALADPLFPGYGKAPWFAIQLLGQLRYASAVKDLFPLIGRRDFDTETYILSALRQIGEPAKTFAIKKLSSRPLSADNERAVLVLLEFLPDEEISSLFREQLETCSGENSARLREYLALGILPIKE